LVVHAAGWSVALFRWFEFRIAVLAKLLGKAFEWLPPL
jgi:hypothetical protein